MIVRISSLYSLLPWAIFLDGVHVFQIGGVMLTGSRLILGGFMVATVIHFVSSRRIYVPRIREMFIPGSVNFF